MKNRAGSQSEPSAGEILHLLHFTKSEISQAPQMQQLKTQSRFLRYALRLQLITALAVKTSPLAATVTRHLIWLADL